MLYSICNGQESELNRLQDQIVRIKDSTQYVDVLNRIGFLSYMNSADSCLNYGIRAKHMSDRLSYSKGKADALVNIATAMYLKGFPSQSLALFTKALFQYQAGKYDKEVILMTMNSAVLYHDLGDSLNAAKFSRLALEQTEKFAGDSAMSMLYAKYAMLKPYLLADSSDYYLDKGYEIAVDYKDNRAILFIQNLRIEKLLKAGQLKSVLPIILGSLEMARSYQMPYYEILALDSYARYFLLSDKLDNAIKCYEKGFQLTVNNGFSTMKSKMLKALLKAYNKKDDQRNIARINGILIAGLERENKSNKNFVGDYIEFNNIQQKRFEFEVQQQSDQRMIYLLIGFSVIAVITIIYILFLNKNLVVSSMRYKVANQKVIDQNLLLKESDHFKASLISMLAHDFRSPLTTTLGMINVLKDNDFEKGSLDNFYNSLQEEVRNTLLTFDNILDWVKKQYAGYEYKEEELLIHDLMQQAASMHNPTITAKGISLINQVPEHAIINTDKEIIQFINRNLIHNAVKFSPQKGNIFISTSCTDNEIIIAVKDEGCGMSSEQHGQLFKMSSGVLNGSSSQKGAGVALSICKEFIDRLNGRIWSESTLEKGTTLYYALPRGMAM